MVACMRIMGVSTGGLKGNRKRKELRGRLGRGERCGVVARERETLREWQV